MATARKLQSGNWRCRVFDYTDTKGKKHYKSFTASTKKQAEYEATLFKLNEKHDCSNITFGEAFNKYIDKRSSILSPYTIRGYKVIYRNHLSKLGNTKINKINQEMLQTFINSCSRTVAPKTVRNINGLLSAIFRAYRPNFTPYIQLPKKIQSDIYTPNDDDIRKLLSIVENTDMEVPIMLAAFCLMRRGEICALEREDIENNIIHIKHSMVRLENGELVKKAPKTYSSDRYVECPDFIIDILPTSGKITHLTPNNISDKFRRIVQKNNLPHFRFHDLRHYSASTLHAIGVPDKYIMERGGWSSNSTLKNVYQHTLRGKNKEINSQINSYFKKV